MRTFTCLTTDSRNSVPPSILLVADEARAQDLSRRQLLESPRHCRRGA